jgi:hypothetical protein
VESWRAVADCAQPENTRFIATANPATILSLLAEFERLELIGRISCNFDGYKAVLDERDQLKAANKSLRAEVARSTERELLQLAELESLRKDAERNNRMLVSAAITIGEICEALGIDNHSEPDMIVEAVRELKSQAT